MAKNMTKTAGGEGVPAIPLPMYVGIGSMRKCQCVCGKKFKHEERYREHWIYAHADEEV